MMTLRLMFISAPQDDKTNGPQHLPLFEGVLRKMLNGRRSVKIVDTIFEASQLLVKRKSYFHLIVLDMTGLSEVQMKALEKIIQIKKFAREVERTKIIRVHCNETNKDENYIGNLLHLTLKKYFACFIKPTLQPLASPTVLSPPSEASSASASPPSLALASPSDDLSGLPDHKELVPAAARVLSVRGITTFNLQPLAPANPQNFLSPHSPMLALVHSGLIKSSPSQSASNASTATAKLHRVHSKPSPRTGYMTTITEVSPTEEAGGQLEASESGKGNEGGQASATAEAPPNIPGPKTIVAKMDDKGSKLPPPLMSDSPIFAVADAAKHQPAAVQAFAATPDSGNPASSAGGCSCICQ